MGNVLDSIRNVKGGNLFLKLDYGSDMLVVFRGVPAIEYSKYGTNEVSSEPKDGFSPKFKMNVIIKENDKYVSKIFSFGVTTKDRLISVTDEYGLDVVYKLKRLPKGSKPPYDILFKKKLTPDEKKVVDVVELQSLDRDAKKDDIPV